MYFIIKFLLNPDRTFWVYS